MLQQSNTEIVHSALTSSWTCLLTFMTRFSSKLADYIARTAHDWFRRIKWFACTYQKHKNALNMRIRLYPISIKVSRWPLLITPPIH